MLGYAIFTCYYQIRKRAHALGPHCHPTRLLEENSTAPVDTQNFELKLKLWWSVTSFTSELQLQLKISKINRYGRILLVKTRRVAVGTQGVRPLPDLIKNVYKHKGHKGRYYQSVMNGHNALARHSIVSRPDAVALV